MSEMKTWFCLKCSKDHALHYTQDLNQSVTELHAAFVDASGQELALNMPLERRWLDAVNMGVTPDDVRLCVKSRIEHNRQHTMKRHLVLYRLIGSEDDIAMMLSEAAEARAQMRVKVLPKGKADVLRATGRSDEPETNRVMTPAEIEMIQKLRAAI